MLPAERQVTVTGEERHQEELSELMRAAPPGTDLASAYASLAVCSITKGKYAGERGIEVLIEGRRVGELTKMQSDRHLLAVDAAFAAGQVPGCCEATVRRTGKGWQVELQMPRTAD